MSLRARRGSNKGRTTGRFDRALSSVTGVGPLCALLMAVLVLVPATASAEPICTNTWTGSTEGEWQTASNWATGKAPSSADVACLAAGTKVKVTEGSNQTGVLLDKGTLTISGGSLELANSLEGSSVSSFLLHGGSLTGAGALEVSNSFDWEGTSTISGTGSLVVDATAEASIHRFNESSESMTLDGRSLVNEGKLSLVSGTLYMTNGAQLRNKNTLETNSEQERAPGGAAIEPLLKAKAPRR